MRSLETCWPPSARLSETCLLLPLLLPLRLLELLRPLLSCVFFAPFVGFSESLLLFGDCPDCTEQCTRRSAAGGGLLLRGRWQNRPLFFAISAHAHLNVRAILNGGL